MPTPVVPMQYEDDIDLLRYGRFLLSYWILLLAFAIAGTLVGVWLARRAPTLYQATAILTVAPTTGGGAAALTPATSRALLANLTLVAETLKEVGITTMSPQAFVQDALVVQQVPTTTLLRLSVSLTDPSHARRAADTLARKAMALSRRLDEEGALASRDGLKVQADEAAQRFSEAQARLSKFRGDAQFDAKTAAAKAYYKQRGTVENSTLALDAEKARLASFERELKAYDGGRGDTSAASVPLQDSANRSTATVMPVAALLRLEAAQSRARIAELERERQALGSRAPRDDTRRLNELYRLEVEHERLKADVKLTKGVYIDLGTRYWQAAGRTAASAEQLRLVDAPVQPDRPLPRGTARSGMFGALMGIVVGTLAALMINRRRFVAEQISA
jgi:uncharacterized protein involved in exopolysaccharide biosynthesis